MRIKPLCKLSTAMLSIVCVLTPLAAESQSKDIADDMGLRPEMLFVLGNIEYILLHELSHLVIRDFDVPVIGPEESAADYIATIVLINAERFDPSRADRARQYLLATANGLATTWEIYEQEGASAKYWDNHGLTIQRFFNIVCLLYGSDETLFAGLPARVGLPANRADRCADEYARAERSLDWLLQNYGRKPTDPPSSEPRLTFETPPTRNASRAIEAMNATGMLRNTLRLFSERFSLPADFKIGFRSCGQTQALWYPEPRELVICYELIDFYYALGVTRSASSRRSILTQ